jgi:hypothetical protein
MYTNRWEAMRLLRVLLGPLAAAWLLCHATMLAAVPVLLWVAAADAEPIVCTCMHGDHAVCPMHHARSSRPAVCAMQDASGGGTAVMTPVPGPLGVVPLVVKLAAPDGTAPRGVAGTAAASPRPVPPDPPPPRA